MSDFTMAEAARRIGCARRTALELAKRGKLVSVVIGAGSQRERRVIPEAALRDYLERIGRSAADWLAERREARGATSEGTEGTDGKARANDLGEVVRVARVRIRT